MDVFITCGCDKASAYSCLVASLAPESVDLSMLAFFYTHMYLIGRGGSDQKSIVRIMFWQVCPETPVEAVIPAECEKASRRSHSKTVGSSL